MTVKESFERKFKAAFPHSGEALTVAPGAGAPATSTLDDFAKTFYKSFNSMAREIADKSPLQAFRAVLNARPTLSKKEEKALAALSSEEPEGEEIRFSLPVIPVGSEQLESAIDRMKVQAMVMAQSLIDLDKNRVFYILLHRTVISKHLRNEVALNNYFKKCRKYNEKPIAPKSVLQKLVGLPSNNVAQIVVTTNTEKIKNAFATLAVLGDEVKAISKIENTTEKIPRKKELVTA